MSSGPLSGRGIVITRPREHAPALADRIRAAGGDPVLFPTIEILPPENPRAVADLIARLDEFQLAIFVSPTAAMQGCGVTGTNRAWPSGLRVAAVGAGTAQALGELGFRAVIAPPGERHFTRDRIGARIETEWTPIAVGPKRFVAVARVNVREIVSALDNFVGDRIGDPLRHGAVGLPGIDAIQVFPVHRAVVDRAAEERRHIRDMDDEHGAAQGCGIERGAYPLEGDDRRDLGAVRAGDERERWPGLGTTDDRYRNARGGVDTGRHLDESGHALAGSSNGRADRESSGLLSDGEQKSRNDGKGEHAISAGTRQHDLTALPRVCVSPVPFP